MIFMNVSVDLLVSLFILPGVFASGLENISRKDAKNTAHSTTRSLTSA